MKLITAPPLLRTSLGAAALFMPLTIQPGCVSPQQNGDPGRTAAATRPAAPPPATGPATAPTTRDYQDASGLIRLQYPAGWKQKKDPQYTLELTSGQCLFTLDVPDLPPHIPGMIPLGLVESGYVKDLKQQHPGMKVVEETSTRVANTKAALVRSTWSQDKADYDETAILMVHGDHVFIVRMLSPSADRSAAKDVFNGIVNSVQWVK